MKVSIMDKGRIYNYKNVFRISIMKDSNEMVMNYVDDNREKHQEVGEIPEYLSINEGE